MIKKFIIHIDESYVRDSYLWFPVDINGTVVDIDTEVIVDPYTEPAGPIGGDQFQKGVLAGRGQAWEAACRIVLSEERGGLSQAALMKAFGTFSSDSILRKYTAGEVIRALSAIENAEGEYERGDEVIHEEHGKGIVFAYEPRAGHDFGVLMEGREEIIWMSHKGWRKTGRNYFKEDRG